MEHLKGKVETRKRAYNKLKASSVRYVDRDVYRGRGGTLEFPPWISTSLRKSAKNKSFKLDKHILINQPPVIKSPHKLATIGT